MLLLSLSLFWSKVFGLFPPNHVLRDNPSPGPCAFTGPDPGACPGPGLSPAPGETMLLLLLLLDALVIAVWGEWLVGLWAEELGGTAREVRLPAVVAEVAVGVLAIPLLPITPPLPSPPVLLTYVALGVGNDEEEVEVGEDNENAGAPGPGLGLTA